MSDSAVLRRNSYGIWPPQFASSAGELLDAVENRALADAYRHPYVDLFSEHGHSARPRDRATAAGGTVVILNSDHSTSGRAMGEIRDGLGLLKAQVTLALGGSSWAEIAELAKPLRRNVEINPRHSSNSAANLRADRLTQIQASFGFPLSALADVLGVARQNLYKWLDATKDITLQESNRKRLAIVERLARTWRDQCAAPLVSVAYEPLADGRTVMQMLKGEVVEEEVIGVFEELARKLRDKPKSLSQRMAEAGYTRRPSARALPSDE